MFNNPNSTHKVELKHSIKVNKGTPTEVLTCQIDPEDNKVACGCGDGEIRIYNMKHPGDDSTVHIKPSAHSMTAMHIDPPITSLKWYSYIKKKEEYNEFDFGSSMETEEEKKEREAAAIKQQETIRNLLCVSTDGCIKEVSPALRKHLYQKIEEPIELFSIDLDKKNLHFATAGKSTVIKYYDAATKSLIREMKGTKEIGGHSNRIQALKFSPSKEEILYTGGWDSTVIVYDTNAGHPVL